MLALWFSLEATWMVSLTTVSIYLHRSLEDPRQRQRQSDCWVTEKQNHQNRHPSESHEGSGQRKICEGHQIRVHRFSSDDRWVCHSRRILNLMFRWRADDQCPSHARGSHGIARESLEGRVESIGRGFGIWIPHCLLWEVGMILVQK